MRRLGTRHLLLCIALLPAVAGAQEGIRRTLLDDNEMDAVRRVAERALGVVQALSSTPEGRDLLGEAADESLEAEHLILDEMPLQVYRIKSEMLEKCEESEPPPVPEVLAEVSEVVFRIWMRARPQVIAFVTVRRTEKGWMLRSIGGRPHLEEVLEQLEHFNVYGRPGLIPYKDPLYLVEVPKMYQLFVAVSVDPQGHKDFEEHLRALKRSLQDPGVARDDKSSLRKELMAMELSREAHTLTALLSAVKDERLAADTRGRLGTWNSVLEIEAAIDLLWEVCRKWEGSLARRR